MSRSAKKARVSVERLRSHIAQDRLGERIGRVWRPVTRQFLVYTDGQARWLDLGFEAASTAGQYQNAVRKFLNTNDPSPLKPFEGVFILDLRGRKHPLETDRQELYRLDLAGSEPFEEVYRLII